VAVPWASGGPSGGARAAVLRHTMHITRFFTVQCAYLLA